MRPNMSTHLCPRLRSGSCEGSCCNEPLSWSDTMSPFPLPALRVTDRGHVDHAGNGLPQYAGSTSLLTGTRPESPPLPRRARQGTRQPPN